MNIFKEIYKTVVNVITTLNQNDYIQLAYQNNTAANAMTAISASIGITRAI